MRIHVLIACAAALGFCGKALAAEKLCKLEISANDALQYDKQDLTLGADCTRVELVLKNVGTLPVQAMGHSWVLVRTPDMQAVVAAGAAAGFANNYLPRADKRVIAATRLIGGGQRTSITFAATALHKGGNYTYFCSFPGHAALMKGKLKFG